MCHTSHNINHILNHLNHIVDKVKEEYKMVKKLGSGGFASVFLLSNQVPLFLSQTFNSNLKSIKSFRISDPTFCLQRQMVGSMQPNTKRRAITRKNGALGQRWPCSVGWSPAGVDRQTFDVSDLFLFLVLFFLCVFDLLHRVEPCRCRHANNESIKLP